MSTGVGITIQRNEVVLRPVQNEVIFVVIGIVPKLAENAHARIRVAGGCDVFGTPGTPEPIQFWSSDYRIGGWRVSSPTCVAEPLGAGRVAALGSLMSSLSSLPGLK